MVQDEFGTIAVRRVMVWRIPMMLDGVGISHGCFSLLHLRPRRCPASVAKITIPTVHLKRTRRLLPFVAKNDYELVSRAAHNRRARRAGLIEC